MIRNENDMIGNTIKNYRIISELGRGGMGFVYLAEDKRLNKKFAVKCISAQITKDPTFSERFYQEARNQARLDHPNIVHTTDFFEEGGRYFIVMEYVAGQSLDNLIKRKGKLTEDEALPILKDTLAGLDFAHLRGIIHRDIKPTNVLVGNDGRAKIKGFGIANLAAVKSPTAIGTPMYMSPEQIMHPNKIDHRSDIYSVGILMFEMLTGNVPFDGETDFSIKEQQIRTPAADLIERNPEIPKELSRIVLEAIEKNPDCRVPGCGEFLRYIEAYGDNMMQQTPLNIEIVVKHGDALTSKADFLALKYANKLYGADGAAVQALTSAGIDPRKNLPKPSGFCITPTNGAIAADKILFVGVGPLRQFGYKEIRAFGRNVLETLAVEAPATRSIVLTLHGAGYGLDEAEAFGSELAGMLEAINRGNFPTSLERITMVEANAGRASRLSEMLNRILYHDNHEIAESQKGQRLSEVVTSEQLRSVGYDSQSKPNVFVAMPFAEEMDDVFHYGIQGAVNSAGFLCERADLTTFTGDVLEWVKKRIESASLVIADLSDANPNVYLEVGYAWGCGRPTVLLVKDSAHLKFDVRGQKCLIYKKIKDLESSLQKELEGLRGTFLNNVPNQSG